MNFNERDSERFYIWIREIIKTLITNIAETRA